MVTKLLGKKLGMTRIYDDQGVFTPVTVIQAGPCTVMQVKTIETDGYNAVQLGFDQVKRSRRKKPQVGHAKKAQTEKRQPRNTRNSRKKTGDERDGRALSATEIVPGLRRRVSGLFVCFRAFRDSAVFTLRMLKTPVKPAVCPAFFQVS